MKNKTTIRLLCLLWFVLGLAETAQAYYNPENGRWPSRDPIGETGGINVYGFVENQPIAKYDLLGNLSEKTCLQETQELFLGDPVFIDIVEYMNRRGCTPPSISCPYCCPKPFTVASGLFRPNAARSRKQGGDILLCRKGIVRNKRTIRVTLLHELIHALQHCTGKTDKGSRCQISLCKEVEAYSRANCAQHEIGSKGHYDCVKGVYRMKQVGYSVKQTCSELDFNTYFDSAYRRCSKLHGL